jgi:hypothetical protein
VVAYKVTQLEPSLELEEMTIATSKHHHLLKRTLANRNNFPGAKCGSAYIDINFKRWLNKILGEKYYRALDPHSARHNISAYITEGKLMRAVMKVFDGHKKRFSINARDVQLDLPAPLNRLNIPGKVSEGQVTISKYVICSFLVFR